MKKGYFQNVIAALIVSFVALSLGASFGVLSGRTNGAFIGMLSAGIIATITSLLGGTRVQCSGPTAPMTAIIVLVVAFANKDLIAQIPNASPDHFINITLILTGVLLIFMGLLKLGKFIKYVPNVVISGFMNGIAILIWADQIKKLFGLGGKTPFAGAISSNVLTALATLTLIIALPKITQKLLPKWSNYLSATLLSIVIVTLVANLLQINIEHVQLSNSVSSITEFSTMISMQIPTQWNANILMLAIPFALNLAFLCYLDTLLTSLVIDKLTSEKTGQNKELAAQGLANSLVAFIGGIPGAQATIRSVLIIKEKANLRLAGILVGIFVIIEVVLFKDFINFIPQAVFSGILFKVGYDVFDSLPFTLYLKEIKKFRWKLFNNLFSNHKDKKQFITNREMILILGTVILTVFFSLNIAVFSFTALFYICNKIFWKNNPIRDLKPELETEAGLLED